MTDAERKQMRSDAAFMANEARFCEGDPGPYQRAARVLRHHAEAETVATAIYDKLSGGALVDVHQGSIPPDSIHVTYRPVELIAREVPDGR